jgi:hypothetical protein
MSKIDEYLQQKNESKQALRELGNAGFTFGIWKCNNSKDDVCDIYIQMSRECECHVVNDECVKKYLIKAIAENKQFIINQAQFLAVADMELARLAAEDEAREVLQITAALQEE